MYIYIWVHMYYMSIYIHIYSEMCVVCNSGTVGSIAYLYKNYYSSHVYIYIYIYTITHAYLDRYVVNVYICEYMYIYVYTI